MKIQQITRKKRKTQQNTHKNVAKHRKSHKNSKSLENAENYIKTMKIT